MRLKSASSILLAFALAALLFGVDSRGAAEAATITVNTTDDELNTDGDCSLREAIQAANTDAAVDGCTSGSGDDVITLPAGTYTLSVPGTGEDSNAAGDLDITSNVTVNGDGANTTTINGGAIDRVLHIVSGTVSVSGVTITNGNAPGLAGGGILVSSGTSLTVANSTIASNTGDLGGGFSSSGALTIENSTISGNNALVGAGIRMTSGTVTITNTTISGNNASVGFGGGGMLVDAFGAVTVTFSNSTITGNSATNGGGIRILSEGPPPEIDLSNTILAGNTTTGSGPDCLGTITSQGHNLIQNTASCTIAGDTTGNITGQDPLLGSLADNGGPTQTHALRTGSPALGAGSPDQPGSGGKACEATDQRGIARPQGVRCDIGAFEFEPTPIQVNTTDDELNADGDCSLREAIQSANTHAAVDACSSGFGDDVITVPAGTYTLSVAGTGEDSNATGDLDVTSNVALNGAGASTTSISG